MSRRHVRLLACCAVGATARLAGQQATLLTTGPRSTDARLEIRALHLAAPIHLDGILDDAAWQEAEPISGFVQSEPDEGKPATERTVVWLSYDATTLYVAAHLYDSKPDALVVNDIRKDFDTDNQDTFEVILDTFADRRNGYIFATNPAGARADMQVANEGRELNSSWDAPWAVHTRRVADGWTVEMAIPFHAIRSGSASGLWGVNFSRRIRRNNEVDFWAPVPRAYALTRLSLAGNLVGLPASSGGRDLRITPYVLGSTVRDTGGLHYTGRGAGGADLKLGLTRGLTLDLTANPDFAQVEADEQQVNLTQFSQFFPEKRDFFLENSGEFYIGDTPRNSRISTAPAGDEDLLLFFSRRMGLAPDGGPVGIDGGARLTGHFAGLEIGALGLRTRTRDTIPGSDYAVVRLRRDLFSSSDVGLIFMQRSTVRDRADMNRVYGADATFRLPARVDWNTFAVNTETDGVTGRSWAFQTSLNREADFSHLKFGLLSIGDAFNDELGFYNRTGVRDWSMDVGIRPRFGELRQAGIREMHPHLVWNYYTDQSGLLVAKRLHSGYTFFLNDGGYVELSVNPRAERITTPLQLDPRVDSLPIGIYRWTEWVLRGGSDPSRAVSIDFTTVAGGLWSGTQRTIDLTVTVRPSYHAWGSVGIERTAATLAGPGQHFVEALWTVRGNYSFSTDLFIDALAQYDAATHQVNANVRLDLIHHPLSNLFLVYNEQRTTSTGVSAPGRSVILKFTRMLAL